MGTVDWSGLRHRCQRRVDGLLRSTGLPQPWDINAFTDRLERSRGREVDLFPMTVNVGDSTGAWQRREDYDLIAYAANTSGFHQDHIILHEIGHMISDHRGRCVLSEQAAQDMAPTLAPAALAHLLDTTSYAAEESEAELIATLIVTRVTQQSRRPRKIASRVDGDEHAMDRITRAFDRL